MRTRSPFVNTGWSFQGKKWDIVVVDINNSDTESDLWVPTKDFLDEQFLAKCHKILDTSIGKTAPTAAAAAASRLGSLVGLFLKAFSS